MRLRKMSLMRNVQSGAGVSNELRSGEKCNGIMGIGWRHSIRAF